MFGKSIYDEFDKHPLGQRTIFSGLDYQEWRRRLDSSTELEEIIQLLHTGLTKNKISCRGKEWLCLVNTYLEYANGYKKPNFFDLLDSKAKGYQNRGELQEAAQKAWSMLCLNFFRNSRDGPDRPSWLRTALAPEVFEKLVWFFTFFDNLPSGPEEKDHKTQIARNFLKGLGEYSLLGKRWLEKESIKIPDYVVKNRPAIVWILLKTRQFSTIQKAWSVLSKDEMEVIKTASLNPLELEVPTYVNVFEAVKDNVAEANLYVELLFKRTDKSEVVDAFLNIL